MHCPLSRKCQNFYFSNCTRTLIFVVYHLIISSILVCSILKGNDKCADCGVAEVTHAVCDVGVLVCTACAAIHATTLPAQASEDGPQLLSVPSHAAFVVDLRKDSVTSHDLFMVRAIGNVAANDVLEAGSAGMISRHPGDPAWRERFIAQKYNLGAHARPDNSRAVSCSSTLIPCHLYRCLSPPIHVD